jgi:hypothetical protein
MRDFMEAHIFAFKLLYEYQYLKRDFLIGLASLDKTGVLNEASI